MKLGIHEVYWGKKMREEERLGRESFRCDTELMKSQPTECGALEQILSVSEILHWAEMARP